MESGDLAIGSSGDLKPLWFGSEAAQYVPGGLGVSSDPSESLRSPRDDKLPADLTSQAADGWRVERFRSCAGTRPSGRNGRRDAPVKSWPGSGARLSFRTDCQSGPTGSGW